MTQIHLVAARPSQKPVIANLIQLYLHDMTEFMPFPVGADGRFKYDFLDRFWRHPYLILSGEEIAGFALVIDECPLTGTQPCWFMAEFFVLKAHRGRGAGRAALDLALAAHPRPLAHWRSPRQ
jgi:predicted acetyltransferase